METHIVKANTVAITNMDKGYCLGVLMKRNSKCRTITISNFPIRKKNTKILISRRMGQ
jgi:hypothetical protein